MCAIARALPNTNGINNYKMQEVLNKTFLDNSFKDYLMVFGFIFSVLILRKVASKKITRLIFYAFRKMGRRINEKEFFDLVLAPLENFVFFSATYIALNSLNFPREFGFKIMKIKSDVLLDRMASGVLIYFFFHTLLRVTDYLAIVMEKKAKATEDYSDDQLIIFFREFLKVILIIVCILVMIRYVFNQDITKLLAGLSIVGAAIALAAKESIENLIASFIIFFDRPFTVGDLLKVQEVNGTVEKIGLRSTRIRTTERTYLTIPNKQMVDSIVDNLSLRNKRRFEMVLALDPRSTVDQLKKVLKEMEEKMNYPDLEEKTILLSDIRIDSYTVTIECITGVISIADFNALKQKLNFEVLYLLETNGIAVAGKERLINTTLKS
jgi:MscS family membrane protein